VHTYTTLIEDCRKNEDPAILKEKAHRTIMERLKNTETTIWSDGSVQENQENGGSGAVICWANNDKTMVKEPAGVWSSSYNAEFIALNAGLKEAMENPKWKNIKSVGICLDNRGVIQRLEEGHIGAEKSIESETWQTLNRARNKTIIIQWVPSHVGIEANEVADLAAKEASLLPQDLVHVDLNMAKNKVDTTITKSWEHKHNEWKRSKTKEKSIPRNLRTELARYRTGHSLHLRSYRHKIGLAESALCEDCGEEDETLHHNLLKCPRWEKQRREAFDPDKWHHSKITAKQLLKFLGAIWRIRA